ncbi:uncharacterized protein LOC141812360 [Curcuma longa]|uniref:uncharacterized protein LOC141812360 n=1 Tax=Curcuma longa TaxID=136217 RepID=UPI003D9E76FA
MEESLEPSQGCFSFKELNLGSYRSQQKKQRQKAMVAARQAAAAEMALRCPRCDSANTKFCYYNNYSKLQPRYYCRACLRHWTEGGSLRNVPVGGSRKNKQHLRDKRADAGSDRRSRFSTNDDSSTLTQESIHSGSGMLVCHPTPPLDGELSMSEMEFVPLFPAEDDRHPSSLFHDHVAQPDAIYEGLLVLPAASNLSHWDDINDLVNFEFEPPNSEIDFTL